jgi:lipid A 3-O-deacylase
MPEGGANCGIFAISGQQSPCLPLSLAALRLTMLGHDDYVMEPGRKQGALTVCMDRSRTLAIVLGIFCVALAVSSAMADDALATWRDAVLLKPSPFDEPQRFEVRFGAFAHGVGFEERGSVDVNAELVFPRLPIDLGPTWAFLVPRPHLGFMANTAGKTSYVYGGFVWTLNLTDRFFVEPMFGGAIHNGETDHPPPDRVALGCPVLFHTGLSVGYRLNERWTLYGTWDHISNANLCSHNVGLNNWGGRIGYKF